MHAAKNHSRFILSTSKTTSSSPGAQVKCGWVAIFSSSIALKVCLQERRKSIVQWLFRLRNSSWRWNFEICFQRQSN
jgi:hypothetical protein